MRADILTESSTTRTRMGEQRRHVPARRVDVKVDVLVRVLGLQVQELRHDEVADRVVDRRAEEHDPVLQQARVDVERTRGPILLGARAPVVARECVPPPLEEDARLSNSALRSSTISSSSASGMRCGLPRGRRDH